MANRLANDPTVPAAQVAHHFYEAGDLENTVTWCERAARLALAGGATASSAYQADRAVKAAVRLGRPHSELAERALFVADAAYSAGQFAAEDRSLRMACRWEHDPSRQAELLVRRAASARLDGRLGSARALLAAATALQSCASTSIALEIEMGFWHLWNGQALQALERATSASLRAATSRELRLRARALGLEEETRAEFSLDGVREVGERSVEAAQLAGDLELAASLANNMAVSADNRGHWAEAMTGYLRSEEFFRQSGLVVKRSMAACNRISIEVELGNLDVALEQLPDIARVFAAAGYHGGLATTEALMARSLARRTANPAALEKLRSAAKRKESLGELQSSEFIRLWLMEAELLLGHPEQAAKLGDELLARVQQYGSGHLLPIGVRRLRSVALALLGRRNEALSEITLVCQLADEHRVVPEQCLARYVWVQLDSDIPATELAILADREVTLRISSTTIFPLTRPVVPDGQLPR
jgi:hypothetical protein